MTEVGSREKFFANLKKAIEKSRDEGFQDQGNDDFSPNNSPRGNLREKLDAPDFRLSRFKEIMASNQTDIEDYPDELSQQVELWKKILQKEKIFRLVYSSQAEFCVALEKAVSQLRAQDPLFASKEKILYSDREQEFLKGKKAKLEFLDYQAGITEVEAGLADTGTLLLVPSSSEPRSLSLVPPVHIAFLKRERILPDFTEWIHQNHDMLNIPSSDHLDHTSKVQLPSNQLPSDQLPSNIVLISGPSKTADIEKRLVYGVHGPCRLILLISH